MFVAKDERRRMILISVLFISSATLVTVPWSVRNSAVLGQASFSKTNLGYHLWLGNHSGAKGLGEPASLTESSTAGVALNSELGEGPRYYHMALSWIVHNADEFVILTGKRIWYFWSEIPRSKGGRKELIQKIVFIIVLIFGAWGTFHPGEKSERAGLLLLFIAIFPIIFYVTHVEYYRHRFHIEPFILILASRGGHRLWGYFRKDQQTLDRVGVFFKAALK